LLRQLEPVVQRRVETGAPQAELLQLQVEIGKVEDQLAGLQRYRPALSARLAALLHGPRLGVLPWPELPVPDEPAVPDEVTLRERLAANPELTALAERVAAAVAQQEAAELETVPDLTVGVDWFDTGAARMPGVAGSGDDPWAVSLGMNLPIYRGRYSAMVAEAEQVREAANQSYHARADQLHADFRMALYRLDDAARQIALYREELLPRARQALELTSTAYRGGVASLLDVIDRERALIAFDQAFWRAATEWGKARADLEALCGPDALDATREQARRTER
jgi:outer membrane protein TolC